MGWFKKHLRQIQLPFHVLHGEVLALQLTLQYIKFIVGVDREKAQLPDQLQRTLLGAEEQVI